MKLFLFVLVTLVGKPRLIFRNFELKSWLNFQLQALSASSSCGRCPSACKFGHLINATHAGCSCTCVEDSCNVSRLYFLILFSYFAILYTYQTLKGIVCNENQFCFRHQLIPFVNSREFCVLGFVFVVVDEMIFLVYVITWINRR